MRFDFPTRTVKEGSVKVLVPKLEAYIHEAWEYAPSKAPVFFNPVMELNRDLAVLALQTYQRLVDKEVTVCEPLSGCGVRGVRFAVETEGIQQVVLGDINPKAVELAKLNIINNKLDNRVLVYNEDANLLLNRHAAASKRFDFIDLDPFGSPTPYLDSALRALRDNGLLALTATDMAPLCGVHPKACLRKYGGKPVRTEYCHELAVRLLTGCLVRTAAKQGVGVTIVFSYSFNHYVRVYALAKRGARKADRSIQELGYILHCFHCLHREASEGVISYLSRECTQCGAPLNTAGPLWLGKLSDETFCSLMSNEAQLRNLTQERQILRLLSLIKNETEAPITYYVLDKICDKLNLPTPPLNTVLARLNEQGFHSTQTHFNSKGIKTEAPAKLVKETIRALTNKTLK